MANRIITNNIDRGVAPCDSATRGPHDPQGPRTPRGTSTSTTSALSPSSRVATFFLTMPDVSVNPKPPAATELAWLDDPSIAPQLVSLTAGPLRLVIAPAIGGALAAFYESTPNGAMHWLRPASYAAFTEQDPLRMASFPLFPYCNRIRDARFAFDGATVDLSGNDRRFAHALHGNAWRRPWQVTSLTQSSVDLHFEHEPDSGIPGDWPFRYRARQRIELGDQVLRITLSAQNLAGRAMPFGMGHHPYYPRTRQTRIYAEVEAMWHADAHVLPTHLGPHPAVDALRDDGLSPDAFDLDNNFANWAREATIAWPDERRQLTMTAEAPFDHMVIFAPANDAQLCVEPVTNTTDCFNASGSREHVGGCVLQPGEEVAATVTWTPKRI